MHYTPKAPLILPSLRDAMPCKEEKLIDVVAQRRRCPAGANRTNPLLIAPIRIGSFRSRSPYCWSSCSSQPGLFVLSCCGFFLFGCPCLLFRFCFLHNHFGLVLGRLRPDSKIAGFLPRGKVAVRNAHRCPEQHDAMERIAPFESHRPAMEV